MNKPFVSYEKEYLHTVTRVRHTVRIKLNSRKIDILSALKYVSDNAVVTMIVDDSKLEGFGEIVFEE